MPFDPPVDLETLAAPVQRIVGPAAPPPLRLMAARGAAPGLKPDQQVTAVAVLARAELAHIPDDVREVAEATLKQLPPPILQGAIGSPETPPGVLDLVASIYAADVELLEKLVLNPAVAVVTIERLAREGSERVTELVATNEERLLAHPSIIKCLYMNKRTRMSTADRVLDLAVRNGKHVDIPAYKEAAEAIVEELIMAPDAEPTPDDLLFADTQAECERLESEGVLEGAITEDDEGKEVVEEKAKSLENRIREMTVSQKIRTAMLGTAAARSLLVRDKNRLVAAAVVRSPLLQESEAVSISMSRSVSEDVLRIIANNGDLVKSHAIKYNLVANPRTPVAIALRLLGHLRGDELKKLAKSKGVAAQVAKMAKQELSRKKPGGDG